MQGEKSKSVRRGVIIGIGSVMNGQMTGTINVLGACPRIAQFPRKYLDSTLKDTYM